MSGQDTPSTAGTESILTFSLPISGKTGSQDDVFNPEKTGLKSPDRPPQQWPEEEARKKTGLEDSYYEDCGPETARYVPGERYIDIRHRGSELEGQSKILHLLCQNFYVLAKNLMCDQEKYFV